MNRSLALIFVLAAAPAFAQWPTAGKPAETPPTPPSRRAAAAPARDDGSGFSLGIRAAWAFPYGDVNGHANLQDNVRDQVPLWLEAGYRFSKSIYAGLYGQITPGRANNCPIGADCSTSGYRFGIEGIYTILPDAVLQPWVGVGVGYEILNFSRAGEETTVKGLELAHVELGADWAASKNFSVGPYASYSLFGKYTSTSVNGVSNDVSDTAGHSWLQVGLKATYKF